MTEEDFIKDLENNIFCRLQPSKVHGIGVFAIRDILKGKNPFSGCRPAHWQKISLKKINSTGSIPKTVREYMEDLYPIEGENIYFPDHSLNEVNVSYFMNHSPEPNIEAINNGEDFIAGRNIKEGEELFIDYRTFSDR